MNNFLIVFFVFTGYLTNLQNDILGTWTNNKTGYTIEIYEQDNQFYGKIVKVREGKSDDEIGHVLLRNIVLDDSPKKYFGEVKTTGGMSANCEIELVNKDRFKLTVKKLFIKKVQMFNRN